MNWDDEIMEIMQLTKNQQNASRTNNNTETNIKNNNNKTGQLRTLTPHITSCPNNKCEYEPPAPRRELTYQRKNAELQLRYAQLWAELELPKLLGHPSIREGGETKQ